MTSSPSSSRHFGMDWLRIGAFQLLILYHVGMAFVPWDYPVKMVDPPLDWATIPMYLTNPWRLALLFVVSGYASAALVRRSFGLRTFVRARLSRLGLPLLFGMAVLVTPQPWIWVVTHYGYPHGFGWFLLHDYYRFQMIHDVAMPTWMHLWFVVYLLVYTLVLALVLALPERVRIAGLQGVERLLAGPGLLPIGIAWAYAARAYLSPGFEDSHTLVGDWSAHATYLPAFLFGFALRGSEPLQAAIARWWKPAALLAFTGWLVLAAFEILWPGNIPAPHALWPVHGLARSAESWGAIIALVGLADRHWNVDNRWRAMLAEAVFPFYLIHQTIIIVVGYWLLATPTGPLARFLILVAATAAGCWAFYLGGRRIGWLRPWIGLARRPRASAQAGLKAAAWDEDGASRSTAAPGSSLASA